MNPELLQNIKKMIMQASKTELSPEEITETANLIDDLLFDSISLIELIVLVEDQYNIEFEDDIMVSTFETVKDLALYVEGLIKGK